MPGRVPAISDLELSGLPVTTSRLAEYESWRRELHRPATYIHKWWARRMGTVVRQVLLSAVGATDDDAAASALAGLTVYDPFAGSGTTVVEAAKLGARVIARDINPVATLTQRQSVQRWQPAVLQQLFAQIEDSCRADIDALYLCEDGAPALHYFWVAVAACPDCGQDVELFSNHVFARHAYPRRHPLAHASCPRCHAVCPVTLGADRAGHCPDCRASFPLVGPVRGRVMICAAGHRNEIIRALAGQAPRRRMYAKMVLAAGERAYRSIDQFDLDLYDRAGKLIADAAQSELVLPDGVLEDGANTVQALRWGYGTWASFFNDRQLYCLGRIAAAIRDLPGSTPEREALAAAFGKTLEHHNLFCSFKGEGTGPVRSIFHNHVLRPERCSVEGNPWGAAGGSGGYAGALSRLLRAHDYKQAPADLAAARGRIVAVTGRSASVARDVVTCWDQFRDQADAVYLATDDAAHTDLPDDSVALIVTDPPYVDNVHYSELADFFHAWMSGIRPYQGYPGTASTRDLREVQNRAAGAFKAMAADVWHECARVLRPDGLLIFSFHQSRTRGWAAVMQSLHQARFTVTATIPVVGEVTTSLTKLAAAEPNRIDVIIVCRQDGSAAVQDQTPAQAREGAQQSIRRLYRGGIRLGKGDIKSAVRAAVLSLGTRTTAPNWESLILEADAQAQIAAARSRFSSQARP